MRIDVIGSDEGSGGVVDEGGELGEDILYGRVIVTEADIGNGREEQASSKLSTLHG